MKTLCSIFVALTALAGSATPLAAKAAPPSNSSPRQLNADTPMKTASGATFTAPKDWFVATLGENILQFDNPEHDLSLTLLEIREPQASKAIERAWQRRLPGFDRKVKQVVNPPPRDGWDEVVQVNYETTTTEMRVVLAVARRKGEVQYVVLLDGAKAGVDRRGAQLGTILSSFKAPGIVEESFRGKTAHILDAQRLQAFEKFVEDARVKAKIPGVAVALLQGGKVIFEKGYGLKALGKTDPVTPGTLFMIGSITKSLTTLMMARLVDEGKFTWDTPVTQLYPSFALGDAATTKKLTMKHTVCACTGLPRQDLEFFFGYSRATPEGCIDGMKTMKPTTGFGETFQYSNTMVSTGGYIAAHVAEPGKALGPAYDAVMQTRVFGPLGMQMTTFDFAAAEKADHAQPHGATVRLQYVALPISAENWVPPIRPAGGAWSNVRDMAQYALLELGKGKMPGGKQVVSEANLLKRRAPQVKINDKIAYGLGLLVEQDHDVPVVWHNGGTLGFNTGLYVLPEHGVGLVVLTNSEGADAFLSAVRRRLFEILFDGQEEARQNLAFSLKRREEGAAKEYSALKETPQPAWAAKLVGTYENPVMGKIRVQYDGQKGVFDAGEWKSVFGQQPESDGRTKLVLLDPPFAGLSFLVDDKDGKSTLTLLAPQQKHVFEKR